MSIHTNDARAIFLQAIELPSAEQRASFVASACGANADLRDRVERLIRSHELLGTFHDEQPAADLTSDQASLARSGAQIGPYKLLQQIGEGGMGVVYMAEQTEPVTRRVALKIIKPGMDTRQVIARFEAERQALAMMDHPNIAKVFDAGCIGEPGGVSPGSPYFVMELVRGIPITKYCDEHQLSLKQRLELFLPVCYAVQHAHQKGIIHRDLKPSNVLVAQYDDKPVPKVIDFGVAKAAQKLTDRTMFTEFGQVVGTLEYMSPEQATFNQLDIDTRSDIYSLGVLLYELLTGCTPFDGQRLRSAAFDEMLRIIREEEPPRPSTRLSSAETLPSIAASRNIEPVRLSRAVRGELDWIVMKALEKDRNRRYETATGFAADVERYLNDEQVLACPPSGGYRLRKFARRYKTSLIAVTLIAFALIAGMVGTTWQAIRAEAQAEQTRTEAAKAQAIADLLQRMLGSATPDQGKAKDYTVRQMLHQFSASLGDQLADQPEVAAAIHSIMAKAYWRMDHEKASFHAEQGLKLHRQLYGADHPKVADSLIDCAWGLYDGREKLEKSVPLIQEAISIYRRSGHDHSLMKAFRVLVRAHVNLTQFADAERVYREALEVYPRVEGVADAEFACILHEMAHAKCKQNQPVEAEALGRRAMDLHLRAVGSDGMETGYGWQILGEALAMQGKHAQAESCFRKSMSVFQKLSSARGESIIQTLPQLVRALRAQDKFDEAIAVFHEALEQNPRNVWLHVSLGTFLTDDLRDYDKAVQYFRKAVELDPKNAGAYGKLVFALYHLGKPDEAVVAYNKAVAIDPEHAPAHNHLAWMLATSPDAEVRDPARAVELAKRAVELAPEQGSFWRTLGAAHYRTGDWDAAIAAFDKSMVLRKGGDGFDWFFVALARWRLGDKDKGREWYDRAVQWMDRHQPTNEELLRFRDEAAELLGIESKE